MSEKKSPRYLNTYMLQQRPTHQSTSQPTAILPSYPDFASKLTQPSTTYQHTNKQTSKLINKGASVPLGLLALYLSGKEANKCEGDVKQMRTDAKKRKAKFQGATRSKALTSEANETTECQKKKRQKQGMSNSKTHHRRRNNHSIREIA